jgi:hypothetical protein
MKRGKRKKRSWAHLKKYQFKKKHKHKRRKGHHAMARKRKGGKRRSSHRRHTTTHRRRRGRSSTGGGYGIKPSRDDIHMLLASAAWGFGEKNARTNADSVLNKVPKPIDQLGFTGNSALVLWLLSVITKNRWARVGARAVANIAAYQLGHKGTAFSQGGEHFTISGWDDDDVAEAIEAHVSGISPYGQAEGF